METALVMEAIGRNLTLEPYFATVVLGGGVLRHGGQRGAEAKADSGIVGGTATLALAHQEKQSRFDLADVATSAKADGDGGYTLEGEKCVVLYGDSADWLIVTARVSGDRRAQDGIGLFLVDAKAPGVSRRGYPTQDGQRAADISLASVKVGRDGVIGTRGQRLRRAGARGARGDCGAGGGGRGRHGGAARADGRVPEDAQAVRRADRLVPGAAASLRRHVHAPGAGAQHGLLRHHDGGRGRMQRERRKAIAAAKVQIGRSARFIGQEAVQLHGGIGMTMEYKAGHYFKRLTMIDMMFGNADHHLRELARAGGIVAVG